MGVKMTGRYAGKKRVELVHEDSGARIVTAAPKDNNGDGSSFSPSDLFSASLGACMLTIIDMVAEREGIDLSGSHFTVEKEMAQNPRRVAAIHIAMHLPAGLDDTQRKKLEAAGRACPVHQSLRADLNAAIQYYYDV